MRKDFDKWNETKKEINLNDSYLPLYHKRQVRWCRLGVNIGFEQDGTSDSFSRPVLILKGFSRHVCFALPLTTSKKKNKYHISLGIVDGKEAFAIISQLRLIDTKRLDKHIATIDKKTFTDIQKAVKDLI